MDVGQALLAISLPNEVVEVAVNRRRLMDVRRRGFVLLSLRREAGELQPDFGGTVPVAKFPVQLEHRLQGIYGLVLVAHGLELSRQAARHSHNATPLAERLPFLQHSLEHRHGTPLLPQMTTEVERSLLGVQTSCWVTGLAKQMDGPIIGRVGCGIRVAPLE